MPILIRADYRPYQAEGFSVAINEEEYCLLSSAEPVISILFENALLSSKICLGIYLLDLREYFMQRFIKYIQLSLMRTVDVDQL